MQDEPQPQSEPLQPAQNAQPTEQITQPVSENATIPQSAPEHVAATALTQASQAAESSDIVAQTPSKTLKECYPEIADDDNEQLFADVRRHWLGRFGIIFTGGILTLALLAFALFIPAMIHSLNFTVTKELVAIISMLFLLVAGLIAIGTFITLWVYNQSRMLITDQNVIELKQMSLFSHKVSHLNMINVEDVTVTKRGILQTIFDYGVMSIETAGEKDNFAFPNTPDPDKYRRIVINCHERAIERVGNMGPAQRVQVTNNGL